MTNPRNEHVSRKDDGWIVRREGSSKRSRLFKKRNDAMEYAGIIASDEDGYIVSHKANGQFKKFKPGNEIRIDKHRIAPIISGTVEIKHSVINNPDPIVQTLNFA